MSCASKSSSSSPPSWHCFVAIISVALSAQKQRPQTVLRGSAQVVDSVVPSPHHRWIVMMPSLSAVESSWKVFTAKTKLDEA